MEVLPLLGFLLQELEVGDPHLGMFSGRASVKEQHGEGHSVKEPVTLQQDSLQTNVDDSELSPVGTVLLLHPTRLLPRHAKLAAVRMEGKNQQFLLEPVESLLAEKGVVVETGLVQVDKERVLHPFPAESHSRAHLFGRGAGHGVDPNYPDCRQHYP